MPLLKELDLSNFNTSLVMDMFGMFEECYSLTSLNISSFNTKKIDIFTYMFSNCSSLTSLNLSNFESPLLREIDDMFLIVFH